MGHEKRLSKRVSMSRRYNLAKKVRDHHKKIKKQARIAKRSGLVTSKRQSADPGIPNSWPLKQQELMQIETQAAAAQKARLSDKERRRMGLPSMRPKTKDTVIKDMSTLMNEANARNALFAKSVDVVSELNVLDQSTASHDEAEHTRRKFYKELKTVVGQADVVVQVLDARDPQSCRNLTLESEIVGAGKRLVLLLNKIDLVPKPAVEAWLARLRLEYPTLGFKACRDISKFAREAVTANDDEGVLGSSASVVGAAALLKLLKKYSLNSTGGVGSLTVGVIGYPNVGKSSVINSLLASANKKGKSVKTGSTAGVTTQHQLISLDKKVTIIDSPGIVFSGSADDASLVIRRAVNVSAVSDPLGVVDRVLRRLAPEQVAEQFRMPAFASTDEFLTVLGKQQCKLKRGGVIDKEATARFALHHWSNGKAKFFTMPPVLHATEGFATLAQPLPQLDIDALLADADIEATAAARDDDGLMALN